MGRVVGWGWKNHPGRCDMGKGLEMELCGNLEKQKTLNLWMDSNQGNYTAIFAFQKPPLGCSVRIIKVRRA